MFIPATAPESVEISCVLVAILVVFLLVLVVLVASCQLTVFTVVVRFERLVFVVLRFLFVVASFPESVLIL